MPAIQQKVNKDGWERQERLSYLRSSLDGEHFLNETNLWNGERNDAQSSLAATRSGDEDEGAIKIFLPVGLMRLINFDSPQAIGYDDHGYWF